MGKDIGAKKKGGNGIKIVDRKSKPSGTKSEKSEVRTTCNSHSNEIKVAKGLNCCSSYKKLKMELL